MRRVRVCFVASTVMAWSCRSFTWRGIGYCSIALFDGSGVVIQLSLRRSASSCLDS